MSCVPFVVKLFKHRVGGFLTSHRDLHSYLLFEETHYEKRLAKTHLRTAKVYKDKAEYLLERGYVQGKTVEELAIEIYKKNG